MLKEFNLSGELNSMRVHLLLIKDKLMDDSELPQTKKNDFKRIFLDFSEQIGELIEKESLWKKAITAAISDERAKAQAEMGRLWEAKRKEMDDNMDRVNHYLRSIHMKYENQLKVSEDSLRTISKQLDNKDANFNEHVKNFLKSHVEAKNAKNRAISQLSSIRKHSNIDSSNRKRLDHKEMSDSKYEAVNLLNCFEKKAEESNKGGLLGSPKHDYFTFKHHIHPYENSSAKKKTFVSELDIPDFTMGSVAGEQEIDAAKIGDQYELWDSKRKDLRHVTADEVMEARSLPISLKGSSTFIQ
jgi:hypothetical protein